MGILAILSTALEYAIVPRWIGALGVAGLAVLGLTYWLTVEPAPRVRVLWRAGVTPARQAALERAYLLENGRDRLPEGSIAYDLLDTSRSNLQALVQDPAVADTNDIDRNALVVPFDADYGAEWMWIAHRTPGIRDGRVRALLLAALAAMAAGGWARDGARLRLGHRKHGNPSGSKVRTG